MLSFATSAYAANLIPNSSFECGTENWIVYGSYDGAGYGNDTTVSGRLTATNSVHGSNSLTWRTRLFPPPTYCYAGNYVLTYSMMSDTAATSVSNYLCSFNYQTLATNGMSRPGITVGTSWARYTNFVTITSNGYFSLKWYRPTPSAVTWIDAVDFRTGTVAAAYAPMSTVEVGLTTTNLAHTLNSGSPIQLKWWNDGAPAAATAVVQFYDYANSNFSTVTVSTNSLAAGPTTISVPVSRVGRIRATAYQPTVSALSELLFFERPYAVTTVQDTNGLIGTHPSFGITRMQASREAGYTFARDLSPAAIVRWSTIQTTRGSFLWAETFADVLMALFSTNGLVPVLVLTPGLDGIWPAWATNAAGEANINDYSNYCFAVAQRFSPAPTNAWHYEIGNEWHNITSPTDFSNSASNRARFIAAGAAAVKAACAGCTVIGIAGDAIPSRAWQTWENLSAGEKANIDIVSSHLYSVNIGAANPNGTHDDVATAGSALHFSQTNFNGKLLWNTELGGQGVKGGLLGPLSMSSPIYQIYGVLTPEAGRDWSGGQRIIVAVQRETTRVFQCLGAGYRKVFGYRADDMGDDVWGIGYGAGSVEFNGAQRSAAASSLIAANYFARNPGLGRITNVNTINVEAYYFTNELGTVVALWSSDNIERTLTLTSNQFSHWDCMANQFGTNNAVIRISRVPTCIVSGGMTTAILKTNVELASVAAVTDTSGPNISIDITPIGSFVAGTNVFKWTVTDNNVQAWSIGSYGTDNTNNGSRIKFFAEDTWKDCGESNHFSAYFEPNRIYNLIVEGKDFYNNITTVTGPDFGVDLAGGVVTAKSGQGKAKTRATGRTTNQE